MSINFEHFENSEFCHKVNSDERCYVCVCVRVCVCACDVLCCVVYTIIIMWSLTLYCMCVYDWLADEYDCVVSLCFYLLYNIFDDKFCMIFCIICYERKYDIHRTQYTNDLLYNVLWSRDLLHCVVFIYILWSVNIFSGNHCDTVNFSNIM